MPMMIAPDAPPLHVDESGGVLVGKSRVLLVLVIQAYQQGESPEGIIEMYDTLELADVHGAIAYYLRHKTAVEEYIAEYERQATELRQKIEERQGSQAGMRELLAKRLAAKRAGEFAPMAE